MYATAEVLVGSLEESGFDVLYDDREKVSPGVKFGDAELLGVPLVVVVGRDASEGLVELWDRRAATRSPSRSRSWLPASPERPVP